MRVRCCLLNCTRVETEIRLAFSGRDPFYIFCAFFFSAILITCFAQHTARNPSDYITTDTPRKKRHKICQMGLFLLLKVSLKFRFHMPSRRYYIIITIVKSYTGKYHEFVAVRVRSTSNNANSNKRVIFFPV